MNNIEIYKMNQLNNLDTLQGVSIKAFQSSFIDLFLDQFKTNIKDTTKEGYKTCIYKFRDWLFTNNIGNPVENDIHDYKIYLDQQGFSAGTKAQYIRAVKQFFTWTANKGYYPNISANVRGFKVKQDNTKKESFSETDIQTILNAIDTSNETGIRDYTMILLSVTAGLRIIEMQRASIEDIQTIKGQKVLYIQGKGHDEKDDYIKLCPAVMKSIEEYLSYRQPIKKTDALFTGTSNRAKGVRLSEPSISRIIKNRFIDAGYDCNKLTAHSLRHTSNTLLFKSGADLYTVQQHARHSDPKTTEIYIHALDKENDKSEEIIYNQIFNPEETSLIDKIKKALSGMTPEQQKSVYKYIQSI